MNGKRVAMAAVFGFAAITASNARAAEVGIDIHAGTLGFGAGLDIDFTEHVGFRIGFNRFSNSESWEEDDLDYEADLDLRSLYALGDWHPFGGSFRITAGIMSTDHELAASAEVEPGDEIGDAPATKFGRLEAEVAIDDIGPYIGVGWDFEFDDSNLAITVDVGVLAMGDPEVELREVEDTGASQAQLNEAEDEIRDQWSDYDIYPVAQVGLVFRF